MKKKRREKNRRIYEHYTIGETKANEKIQCVYI